MVTASEWAALIGFIAPLIVSFLNQEHWSSQVKQIVAIVVAALLGVLTVYLTGVPVNWHSIGTSVAVVYAVSQGIYALIWKPSGVAPAIESATSAPVKVDNTGVTVVDPATDDALALEMQAKGQLVPPTDTP